MGWRKSVGYEILCKKLEGDSRCSFVHDETAHTAKNRCGELILKDSLSIVLSILLRQLLTLVVSSQKYLFKTFYAVAK